MKNYLLKYKTSLIKYLVAFFAVDEAMLPSIGKMDPAIALECRLIKE